jgi:hypothetical protein
MAYAEMFTKEHVRARHVAFQDRRDAAEVVGCTSMANDRAVVRGTLPPIWNLP